MKRRIEVVVEGTCKCCPFCQYDPWYVLGGNVGYDCKYPGNNVSRIVNDGYKGKLFIRNKRMARNS